MIKEFVSAVKSSELDTIVSRFPQQLNLSDVALAPFMASAVNRPFVYITQSKDGVYHAVSTLQNCGINAIGVATSPEPPLFSQKDCVDELGIAVSKFLAREVDVLVLYAPLALQSLPKIVSAPLALEIGQKLSRNTLIKFLEDGAFQYTVQGDTITVWQGGLPVRIMFYGNQIESLGKSRNLVLTPQGTLVSPESAREALRNIKPTHENTAKILGQIHTAIDKENKVIGTRWLAPLVFPMQSVAELLGSSTIVLEQPRQLEESLREFQKSWDIKIASLIEGGLLLPQHSTPAKADFFKGAGTLSVINGATTGKAEFQTLPVPNFYNSLSALVPDMLRNISAGKTVIAFAGKTPALANYLFEKKVEFEFATLTDIHPGKINVIKAEFNLSFELAKERIVIYSLTQPTPREETKTLRGEITFTYPDIGEVVVHEFHGLGRYLGVQELDLGGTIREYIALQYDGGAIVYVPHDQTHMLSNYIGEPTRLNRIGGQDFTAVKQRLRRRLTELSHKLVKLYAKRGRAKANKYELDEKLISDFVAAFPHEYTEDQKSACRDLMSDMSGERITDRLICGDVGVGKTEVALVAAFRAVMCGFQVALLCPTTILSEQHYSVLKDRLGKFGARVEVLNRFKSDKEVQVILSALEHGEVDVLVGTHRILSPDVRFKNLSLLILDEEQRFGVTHKEKIKQLKLNVDVITLSATPIPRTLNMALLGIRDISTINTPPKSRLNVLTYVTEFSDELLVEAIRRELHRGGQTLVLFNQVERIEHFALNLRKRIDAHIAVAHGQMKESELAAVIKRLYNKEIDVLVCSTIIENGIDIATANTLVVIDADKLGVAQMHQIRGRVGRSDKQAFAYFTYSKGKELSDIARERLEAIRQHSKIGSGYDIAMRDLQLRGAGDILGENQSGHINQVGFELYTRILAEVTRQVQSQGNQPHLERSSDSLQFHQEPQPCGNPPKPSACQ